MDEGPRPDRPNHCTRCRTSTNGEGTSVAPAEKRRALEYLFGRGLSCRIVPAVMEGNLVETLELVRTIAELPAAAVLVLPPYYFKPLHEEGLRRFLEPVLAAARQPVILYHIPKYAVAVPASLVSALKVWGVKDSGDEPGYAEAIRASGKGVLVGTEDDLWTRIAKGAEGVISALANAVPERVVEIHVLARSGTAKAGVPLAARLQQIRALTKAYAAPAVLKRLAETRHGFRMGAVRPSLLPAPADYDPMPILGLAGLA